MIISVSTQRVRVLTLNLYSNRIIKYKEATNYEADTAC